MSGYRCDVEASAGPARGALVGGGGQLLVRVRLFDRGVQDAPGDAFTDLRPADARELAFCLLACAEHAERQSGAAGFWGGER